MPLPEDGWQPPPSYSEQQQRQALSDMTISLAPQMTLSQELSANEVLRRLNQYLVPIITNDGTRCYSSDMLITCPEPWLQTRRTFTSDFYDLTGWYCRSTDRHCASTSGGRGCGCGKGDLKRERWQVVNAQGLSRARTRAVSNDSRDPAESMTIIEQPRRQDRAATHRRFDFLLRQFVGLCPMAGTTRAGFADMMVYMFERLEEIGLDREEGLLALSNNLYGLTEEVSSLASVYGYPMQDCVQLWAMYMQLRKSGHTPERAKEGISGIVVGLFNATGSQGR